MEELLTELANILEVEKLEPETIITDLPECDSLSMLSIIAMLDANYSVNLSAKDLREVNTAKKINELISQKQGA